MRAYSWTIINTWAKGDQLNAIKMLFDEPVDFGYSQKYMDNGKDGHELISVMKLKPLSFMKETVIYEDKEAGINYYKIELDGRPFHFVIDARDPVELVNFEWKFSNQKPQSFDPRQHYTYNLGLSIAGEPVAKWGYTSTCKIIDSNVVSTGLAQYAMSENTNDIRAWLMSQIHSIEDYLEKLES